MKPVLFILPVLAVIVFILVRAEILKKKKLIYIFKPTATLLVIMIAVFSFWEHSLRPSYTLGILAGLLLSLGGDMALMFQDKKKPFMIGLGLFLSAHLAYSAVFIIMGRFSDRDLLSGGILLASGIILYLLMNKNLGKMKLPVIFYLVVISFMVNRAFSVGAGDNLSRTQALMIIPGSALFYISDVILAMSRFLKPWKYNRISLVFYYSGQTLIALSAAYFLF